MRASALSTFFAKMRAKTGIKRIAKYTIKFSSHALAAALLILCSLWILRAPIVQWLARQPLPNGWTVELTGLSSPRITQWNFKQLSLSRDGALYFTLNEGEITWNPAFLWQKQISVNRIILQSMVFFAQKPKPPSEFNAPDLTQLPSLAITHASIKHLIFEDQANRAPGGLSKNLNQDLNQEDYAFEGDIHLLWNDILIKANGQIKNQHNQVVAQLNTQARADNQWEITAQVDEPQGGMLARRLSLGAALKAQATLSISLQDLRYQINLHSLEFPWQNQLIQSTGTLWINAARTTLEVSELHLTTDGNTQHIKALFTPDDRQIHARLNQFPIGLLSPWVPLEGGQASGAIDLYWQNQTTSLQLDATGILISRWRGWPLELKGDYHYSNEDLLRLENIECTWGEGRLKSTVKGGGIFDWHGDKNNLSLSGDNFTHQHLQNLPIKWLNQPSNTLARELHGLKFSAQVASLTLQGPLNNPAVTYNLNAKTQWRQHEFNLRLNGDGNLSGANLSNTQIQQGGGTIDLNGRLQWRGPGTKMQLAFNQWGEAFWSAYALEKLTQIKARVNGQAQLTGALAAPIINTQLTLNGELPLSQPTAFTLDNQAQYQYTLNKPWPHGLSLLSTERIALNTAGNPRFELQGFYRPDGINLKFTSNQWNSELNQLLYIPLAAGEGRIELSLQGTPKNPQLQGQWRYTIPFQAQPPLIWQGDLQALDNSLIINSQLNEADNTLAQLTARYPLARLNSPNNLDGELELKANLSASRLFLNNRRYPAQGQLDAKFTLNGTLATPKLNGAVNVTDGFFADKSLGYELKNINIDLHINDNQLNVEKAQAQDNSDGTLALSGGCLPIYPASNCQFKIALKQFQIVKNRQLNARASGEITSHLINHQLNSTGTLTLAPTTLMLSNLSGSRLKELTVEEIKHHKNPYEQAFWPSPWVDIQWQLGGNSQVRGRGLEAQIAGTLRTQGPLNQLAYNGNFYTTKGTMELFNKRFILEPGDIRLAPGQIYLNLPAVYQSRVNSGEDLSIQARLNGDLNHLKLDLQSTPTLPPDEVLARLIFGKQIQTITPFEGLQLASALQKLRSGDSFNLMDSARALLGVDRLNIESQKNTDGTTGVNVGVGKYISDKVYVEIQRTPNPNTPWQGQIEIELTPSVNFESNTGEHGQGGAKLLWRRDY